MGQSRPAKDKVEFVVHFTRSLGLGFLRVNLIPKDFDK